MRLTASYTQNSHAVTHLPLSLLNAGADLYDLAGAFVTERVAFVHVGRACLHVEKGEVGVADACGVDFDEEAVGRGDGDGEGGADGGGGGEVFLPGLHCFLGRHGDGVEDGELMCLLLNQLSYRSHGLMKGRYELSSIGPLLVVDTTSLR